MRCASCGHENPDRAKFCLECGARFSLLCTSCGAELPPSAKFCLECGEPAAKATARSEIAEPSTAAPTSFASGRYQIQRFLGEGAKKRVYLATDTRLSREVALAIIKTEGLDDEGRVRVRREAEAMGQLGDHAHIVTVYDVAEEEGRIFLVAQYMAGGDLEARLRAAENRRLPLEETLGLAEQICRALEHAHARGVIHRDLKPGNIYLAEDGTARLGDFGLALSLDRTRLTQEGMMVGTVAYMPPEQALGTSPDARNDLYSLGATVYEMVTGRPPFLGDDAVAIISQHINTSPVAPSWHNAEVPKPLERLILGLLTKDPDGRPQSASEVRQTLASISSIAAEPVMEPGGPEANPLDRLSGGVFVGREPELEEARACLDEALSGQGSVLMLVGEPGIGKTRTAEELTTYARLRGAQVLWGRCYEGEGAPPYWPWAQIIRSYVHDREPTELISEMGSGAAAIAEVISEVRQRLPGLPEPPNLDPEQARFRLFDSVTTFVKNAATRQPLILILDDLHWADKSSLLLLQFLARALEGSRMLVLGTYRDVELRRQHPLSQTLAALAREQLTERILLRGLGKGDVARFIEMTAGKPPPAALVAAVFRETEGNPFFMHEVVRLLAREGRLERSEAVTSWSVEVPEGVREVIGQRLDHLSEETNRILTIASAVGRDFQLEVLERVSDLRAERLLDLVEEAIAAHLVEEVPQAVARYRFCHALVRETLYEELTTTRRVRLHRQIGEALEELYGERSQPRLTELAHHFCEAAAEGNRAKAVDYAFRAAQRAEGQYGYEEAVAHYQRALQVLELEDPVDQQRLAELLLSLGSAFGDSGDQQSAQQALRRAIEAARTIDAPHLFAGAVSRFGEHRMLAGTTDPELARLTEEALKLLPEEDSAERTDLLVNRSMRLGYSGGNLEDSASVEREARAMAERVGDTEALARLSLARIAFWTRPTVQKLADLNEGIETAQSTGESHLLISWMRFFRLGLEMELGDLAAFDADLTALARIAEKTHHPADAWHATHAQAVQKLTAGEFPEAERLASDAFALGLSWSEGNARQYFGAFLVVLRWLQGRLGEIEAASRRGFERYAAVPAYAAALPFTHAALGQEREARERFERLAAQDFRDVPEDFLFPTTLSYLAEVSVFLRDHRRAGLLYDMILPYSDRILVQGITTSCLGSAAHHLGRLATLLERWPEAERHFEAAIEANERILARPFVAQSQQAFAEMLLTRDEPGDRERAVGLATRALATGQEVGMAQLVQRALATKLEAQGQSSGTLDRSIDIVASSVGDKHPDLAPHAAPDGTVTLMFSDMEGFTAMTERVGDLRAREVIRDHNVIVREQLTRHGGYEVELRGDGFLLAFGSARQALLCAIEIQRAFAARNQQDPEEPIRVRIGLHTGEVLKDAHKFFGKTVILAARVAAQAEGGEILVSSLLKELTQSVGDIRFGEGREADLKGISETQRLFPVEWQ